MALGRPLGEMPIQAIPVSRPAEVPNKVLYVQSIPAGITEEDLVGQFRRYPGFVEVRTIPNRPDMAFVEYESDAQGAMARQAMAGFVFVPDAPISVTFARK